MQKQRYVFCDYNDISMTYIPTYYDTVESKKPLNYNFQQGLGQQSKTGPPCICIQNTLVLLTAIFFLFSLLLQFSVIYVLFYFNNFGCKLLSFCFSFFYWTPGCAKGFSLFVLLSHRLGRIGLLLFAELLHKCGIQ